MPCSLEKKTKKKQKITKILFWAQWLQATTNHFNFFDKDRNGVISREEFTALYQNLSQQ